MEQGLIILIAIAAIVVFVAATRKKATVNNEPLPKIDKKQENTQNEIKKEFNAVIMQDGKEMKGKVKMTQQGLQVFDENGNCVLDVTDRLTKYLGKIEFVEDGEFKIPFSEKTSNVWIINDIVWVESQYLSKHGLFPLNFPTLELEGNIIKCIYKNQYPREEPKHIKDKYNYKLVVYYGVY